MSNETTSSDLQLRDKQSLQEEHTRPGPLFRPDVDIFEDAQAYHIHADLPGVDDEHVDVRLDKGVLSLDATLATSPGEAWRPLHTEYRFGSYHREFRLPDEIDSSRVSASMRDGVLELVLPKSEQHQPRRIQVSSA